MEHIPTWPRIAIGLCGLGVLVFFQYVRLKRAIAYYRRDRKADVQTLFDGNK